MIDHTKQPNGSDRPEEEEPEPSDKQSQPGQPQEEAQPAKRLAPGRRPFFLR